MKIAVFTPFFTPEVNGITHFISGLNSSLVGSHSEIKIDIFTFDTLNTKKYFEEISIFRIYRFPCTNILGGTYILPKKYFHSYYKIKKIFRENSYQFVNTYTRFFLSSLVGYLFSKKFGVKIIHIELGSTFVQDGSLFVRLIARFYDNIIGRFIILKSNVVAGCSVKSLEFVKKLGGQNKVVQIIYNGIHTEYWKQSQPKPRNEKYILSFCGRLTRSKGVHDLLNALSRVQNKNWELNIIGKGNYENSLHELAQKLDIYNKIIWHGELNPNQVKDILLKTNIFINPSYTEGLPTSILEAGSMQCICIATDVGGTNEIIDHEINGFLFEPRNISQLINKLDFVMRGISMDNMGLKLSKKINQKFNWKTISNHYYKILIDNL